MLITEYDYGKAAEVLGIAVDEAHVLLSVDSAVRRGIPTSALRNLKKIGLTIEDVGIATGIARRTLVRRLDEERFDAVESDRVLRLGVMLHELQYNLEADELSEVVQWLKRPNALVGNRPPLELIDTGTGQTLVAACASDWQTLREAQTIQTRLDEAQKKAARKKVPARSVTASRKKTTAKRKSR